MSPGRLLPMLLLGAAGVAGVRQGPDLVRHTTDLVKIALTRYEMAQLVQAWHRDMLLGGTGPRPENLPGFQGWVRDTLRASGGRDVANDLWGQPWSLVRREGQLLLRSCGPNQRWDACAAGAEPDAAADDLCELLQRR